MSGSSDRVLTLKVEEYERSKRIVSDKASVLGLHETIMNNYQERPKPGSFLDEGKKDRLSSVKYAFTPKEAAVVDSVIGGVAVFMTLRDQLKGHVLSDPEIGSRGLTEDEESYISLYSLYAACAQTIESLVPHTDQEHVKEFKTIREYYQNKVWGTSDARFTVSNTPEEIRDGTLTEYISRFIMEFGIKKAKWLHKDVNGSRPEDNFAALTLNFYGGLMDHLVSQKEQPRFKDLQDLIDTSIELPSLSLRGFNYRQNAGMSTDDPGIQLNVSYEDIIGNIEAKSMLKSTVQKLFRYDPETRTNDFLDNGGALPRTVLLYAGPGTGKTMTLKATLKYAFELSKLTGKEFKFVEISQMVKDKYVGESSKKLVSKLHEGMNPDSIGIITIEDIDALFENRSGGDGGSSRAEQNVLQTLLNTLEGVGTEYYGNWLVISTTNRAHGIDPALKDRIAQKQVYANGAETPEEFVELVTYLAKPALEHGYLKISDKQWKDIGKMCAHHGYNGRHVRNAVQSLMTNATMLELDEELLLQPDSEKFARDLKKTFKKTTGVDLITSLEEAMEDDKKQREYDMLEREKRQAESYYIHRRGEILANEQLSQEKKETLIGNLEELKADGQLEELLAGVRNDEIARLVEENEKLQEELEDLRKPKGRRKK